MSAEVETLLDAPWSIPSSWKWSRMGQMSTVITGGTPSTLDRVNFEGGTIPWITPADLSGFSEKIISCGARSITQRGLDNSGAQLIPKWSVIFSSRAPIGYVAIAGCQLTTNQGCKSFALGLALTSEYVYYYLQRAKGLALKMASGTTFLELSKKSAESLPIPLAPLPEQRRIVEAIEANFARLEAGVAALERARMKLERYRASVLEGVWTKGGPNLTQLGTLVTEHLCNGISIKGSDAPPGTPALRLSAMGESGFDYSDVRYLPLDNETAQDLAIRAGEFFISRGNGSLHLVGRGTLAQATPQRVVYPDTMTRVRLDRARVDPRWIALIWASRGLRNQIEARVKTTAGIFKISHPQMETIEIPLPDLEVQATLIRDTSPLLDNSTKSLSEIQESLGRCKSLRQSVLKSAFEGRLVPQDPNDEPASALLERIQHEQSPPSHSMTRKRNAVRAS